MSMVKKKGLRGGVLPDNSLVVVFSVVILVSFLLLMFSNIQASAPSFNAQSYLNGTGDINETTNPAGLVSMTSIFSPLGLIIFGILVIIGMIIGATLLPSWL